MMNTLLLAADVSAAVKQILMVVAPLAGGMMLAYGVFQAVVDLRGSTRQKVVDRLKDGQDSRRQNAQKNSIEDVRRRAAEATGFMARAFSKMSFTAKFQRALEQADMPWSAPQVLVNLSAVATLLMAALMFFQMPLLAAAGVGAGVFILPVLYLFRARKKRLNRLVDQLPDVFELLSQALRAGHSLASGMQLVAKEMPDPAGIEFGRVFHEQNLGLKIEDAMRNMADRVDMLDVRFFVTAVLIQRQTGGDLAEVLDKIGSVIRERIKLFGTVQALTAEGRLSGYVLLALPVIVFVVMLQVNREYAMLLLTNPIGKMMLTIAIVMQIMGWLMIKKIVNIKV
ncbi:Bacterial type II secretion system protein F domain protein [Phycisphaerae bacterium RAS1]|nr:Bacterial type II secretion system protein F domain protein [Phycisphaerae bacterium RAS1]